MHAVGSGGQGDVDPIVYQQARAMSGADRPQRRGQLIELAPTEVFFAELEGDANARRIERERAEHAVADLSESARRDQTAVANQVELEIDRRTEHAIQSLLWRKVVALTK
jgi:hypothetical protein